MRPWPLLLLAASSDARCRCDRRVIVATTVNGVRTASLLVPSAARVGAALVVYHEDSADAAAGLEPTEPRARRDAPACFVEAAGCYAAHDLHVLYPWLAAFADAQDPTEGPATVFGRAYANAVARRGAPRHATHLTAKAHFIFRKVAAIRHAAEAGARDASVDVVAWADADIELVAPLADARFLAFARAHDVATIHRYVVPSRADYPRDGDAAACLAPRDFFAANRSQRALPDTGFLTLALRGGAAAERERQEARVGQRALAAVRREEVARREARGRVAVARVVGPRRHDVAVDGRDVVRAREREEPRVGQRRDELDVGVGPRDDVHAGVARAGLGRVPDRRDLAEDEVRLGRQVRRVARRAAPRDGVRVRAAEDRRGALRRVLRVGERGEPRVQHVEVVRRVAARRLHEARRRVAPRARLRRLEARGGVGRVLVVDDQRRADARRARHEQRRRAHAVDRRGDDHAPVAATARIAAGREEEQRPRPHLWSGLCPLASLFLGDVLLKIGLVCRARAAATPGFVGQ